MFKGEECPSCWPAENKACDCFAVLGFCDAGPEKAFMLAQLAVENSNLRSAQASTEEASEERFPGLAFTAMSMFVLAAALYSFLPVAKKSINNESLKKPLNA